MKTSSRGYTLVELMVALVLGLLLAGAAYGVYESGRRAGSYSEALGRYQETARYAQAVISEELRMAGYFGCFKVPMTTMGDKILNMGSDAVPVNVGLIAAAGYSNPVFGVEGNAGDASIPPHKNGTDVVRVQHASREGGWLAANTSETATQTTVTGSSFLTTGDLAVMSNCLSASVFSVGAVGAAGANHLITHPALGGKYGARTETNSGQMFGFVNRFLYVREVDGRSVLTMRTLRGNGAAPLDDDIAEGIEDLQFWYGYDPSSDFQASAHQLAFWKADQVPNSVDGWRRVVSVRVCMLSVSADKGLATKPQNYTDCSGNSVTAPDTKIRFPVSFTVNLRNRVEG